MLIDWSAVGSSTSSGYGEVRWDAEVTNQDEEIVAQYDVLTMVATVEHWASVQ